MFFKIKKTQKIDLKIKNCFLFSNNNLISIFYYFHLFFLKIVLRNNYTNTLKTFIFLNKILFYKNQIIIFKIYSKKLFFKTIHNSKHLQKQNRKNKRRFTCKKEWREDPDSKFQKRSHSPPKIQILSSEDTLWSASQYHYLSLHATSLSAHTTGSAASTPEAMRTTGRIHQTLQPALCTLPRLPAYTHSSPSLTAPSFVSPPPERTPPSWEQELRCRHSTAARISARRWLGRSDPGPAQRRPPHPQIEPGRNSGRRWR